MRRRHGGKDAKAGLTDNCDVFIPVTETQADIDAAGALFRERNDFILGAIYGGKYSDAYLKRVGKEAPKVEPGDFELIGAKTDFLGLNIYTGTFVRATAGGVPEEIPVPPGFPRTDSPWLQIIPQAIYWGLRYAHEAYDPKEIYITENGCGYDIEPVVNGEVLDLHRREFLRGYLREVQRGSSGRGSGSGLLRLVVPGQLRMGGAAGTRRFGIVHVDFQTQKRTPKLSSHYYSEVMRLNQVIRGSAMSRFGIDLGGTKIEGVVVNASRPGTAVCRLRVPTESAQGYPHVLSQVATLVGMLERTSGVARPRCIGFGTPGVTDPATGIPRRTPTPGASTGKG